MPSRRDPETGLALRGTSNSNQRGSAESRRRRKEFLLETYPADVDVRLGRPSPDLSPVRTADGHWFSPLALVAVAKGEGVKACRCFMCGTLLTFWSMTVDRIIPHCKGGTYRRNNIRPACLKHNSETGGALANGKVHQPAKKAARRKRALKVAV